MTLVKAYPLGNFNLRKLNWEISTSGHVGNFGGLAATETEVKVYGDSLINESGLDAIVANHVNDTAYESLYFSILDRKKYCEELMERFKRQNMNSGITASQGFWLHTRLRKHVFTYSGVEYTLDVMNLIISGDVELGCIALMYFPPDDMTQSYHFFTQERIDWLVADLKQYLGWP